MIYIATHKKFNVPNLNGYCALQVGAEGKEKYGYLRDNIGNHISGKNANYCELTGLYWIWKNTDDSYKGLVHYRRYFGRNNLSNKISDICSYEYLLNCLKSVDIVLPYVEYFKQNAKEEILLHCCTEEIFDKLRQIIETKYPDYIETYDCYFNENKASLFNMLFCKREIFDAYCEWLFSILFVLEKQVDLAKLNTYQQRLYGFLSERLLNVWVIKNKLVVKHLPVIHMELPVFDRIRLVRRRFTNRFRFWIKRGSQR
ncbi:MAG: DUF4422 domain-containing protein [Roseburia faecis]